MTPLWFWEVRVPAGEYWSHLELYFMARLVGHERWTPIGWS